MKIEGMVIVSACLAGLKCRYDGKIPSNDKVSEIVQNGNAILVCPEQLGGLPTPRTAAERKGESVITKDGQDVTWQYIYGAEQALKITQSAGAKTAILKARSPSCGSGQIYDGTFTGKLTDGNGVFAEMCKKVGIKVLTEEDL